PSRRPWGPRTPARSSRTCTRSSSTRTRAWWRPWRPARPTTTGRVRPTRDDRLVSKHETVKIRSGTKPFGDRPCSTAEQINAWLDKTDPAYVRGAGQTYANASSKIEQAINALEEHASRIVQIWKGPDAAKA